MTDLPNREWLRHPAETGDFVDYMNELAKLAVAYCDGELKTRDEMDEERLSKLLDQYEWGVAYELAELYADTLWGVDDE